MFLESELGVQLTNILLPAIGIILTGLATWVSTVIVNFLNSKIKDKKVAGWLKQINDIVFTCVREVTQTYVSTLKDKDMFDEEAQKIALEKCVNKVMSQLNEDGRKFISDNYGDVRAWIITQIESTIGMIKLK